MAVTLVASVGGCERRGLRNVGLCHDENEVKAAKVANLTVEQTREAVAEARTRAAVQELPVPGRLRFDPDDHISLEQWHKASPAARKLLLRPEPGARGTVPRFTAQTGTDIEWAMWSWNPVTGFEHDCPYSVQPKSAEAIPQVAEQVATLAGVAGATPARSRPRPGWRASTHSASSRRCTHGGCWLNVFLVSMGDMFGRWVPDGWVEAVLREVRAAPQWNFLGPPFRRASNTSRALPKSAAEVRKGRRSCQTTWLTVERSPYMRGRCLTPWSGWRQSPSEDLAAEARRLRPDVEIMIRRTVGPA